MKEERFCLECGDPIQGRRDKKFCDDNCRNNYNNILNSETNNTMRNINNVLRKNRRILESLIPAEGKGNVSKTKLSNLGFNFTYFTQTHTSKKGLNYFICYDYGYTHIGNDYFMIVKWGREYVKSEGV